MYQLWQSFILYASLFIVLMAILLYLLNQPKTYKPGDKPLILFLRSFETDNSVPEQFMSMPYPIRLFTIESLINLDYRLNIIGDFVSVGHPSTQFVEVLDKDGNVRYSHAEHKKWGKMIYIKKENWQNEVLDLFNEASMIIIHPGPSEGLLWELEQLCKQNFLYKTIIVVNVASRKFQAVKLWYEIFQRIVSPFLSNLPAYNKKLRFIYFNENNESIGANLLSNAPTYQELERAWKEKRKEKASEKSSKNEKLLDDPFMRVLIVLIIVMLLFIFIKFLLRED